MSDTIRRWTRRQWLALGAAAVALLFAGYVGSYAAFYHRGVAEADAFRSQFIFYEPIVEALNPRSTSRQHEWLGPVFSPLNDLHRRHFGGRAACKCVLHGLSRDE